MASFILIGSLTAQAQEDRVWSLEECVNYALDNNISVKRNQLNVESAEIQAKASKSNFLPNLNGNASQRFAFGFTSGNSGVSQQDNNYSTVFSASSSMNLFNGFRNISEYKQAKLGIESSKVGLEKMENDISLNVVNAYLNILFNKENLEVAKIQVTISEEQVTRIKSLVEAGSAPMGDLYDIEATLANDIQNQVTVQNSLDLSKLTLAQILQIPSTGFDVESVDVGSPSLAMAKESSSTIYERALQIMPEIKRAQLDLESTDYDLKIAKSGFYPVLSFSAGLGSQYFYRPNAEDFVNPINGELILANDPFSNQIQDNFSYSFGFNMSIPIFNRNVNKNNVRRATIGKTQQELILAEEKQNLYQNIERAYQDAKAATKTFEASKLSLKSQLEAFKNAQERFALGAMTSYDFNQARNGLVNAQATLIRSKYDYVFKMKLLKFYYGEPILDENW